MVNDPLDSLRNRFLARCREQLPLLRAAARREDTDGDARGTLVRTVHSLAGAGGTFGFSEVSHLASHLEALLTGENGVGQGDIRAALNALIAELERVAG